MYNILIGFLHNLLLPKRLKAAPLVSEYRYVNVRLGVPKEFNIFERIVVMSNEYNVYEV